VHTVYYGNRITFCVLITPLSDAFGSSHSMKVIKFSKRDRSVVTTVFGWYVQQLESLLPARPKANVPTGDHVEEVNMIDFDAAADASGRSRRGEAYNEDDDDDDGPGVQRVQCANQ